MIMGIYVVLKDQSLLGRRAEREDIRLKNKSSEVGVLVVKENPSKVRENRFSKVREIRNSGSPSARQDGIFLKTALSCK